MQQVRHVMHTTLQAQSWSRRLCLRPHAQACGTVGPPTKAGRSRLVLLAIPVLAALVLASSTFGIWLADTRQLPLPELPADLEVSMPMHGRLVKRGPQAGLEMLAQGSSLSEMMYGPQSVWAMQRLAGKTPPFPSKYPNIMYNDKYRIIYCKSPKTAGTTLVG